MLRISGLTGTPASYLSIKNDKFKLEQYWASVRGKGVFTLFVKMDFDEYSM